MDRQFLVRLVLWAVIIAVGFYFLPTLGFLVPLLLGAATVAATLVPISRRVPGPRWLTGTTVMMVFMVLGAGLVVLAGWLLAEPIQRQIARWPEIREILNQTLGWWSDRLGLAEPWTVSALAQQILQSLTGENGGSFVRRVISNTGSVVVAATLIGFGALFMLAEPPGVIVRQLHRLAPRFGPAIEGSIRDMEVGFRWWLLGTLFSMTVSGLGQGLGYWLVGLRFALPMGIFAGFAAIVPTFGPLAAFLVALMIAGTQSMTQVIGVTVVYVIVQLLESNLLMPLVMQRAVNIPPLVTLFTIILWGQLFGILGLLLAIPINLTVWTLIDRFYIRSAEQNVRTTDSAQSEGGGEAA